MNLSQSAAGTALSATGVLLNGGSVVVYSGAQPASPETALAGNVVLATLAFSATAFGAPAYSTPNMQMAASFTSSSITPSSAGLANWARGYKSDGITAEMDFMCVAPYNASPTFTPPVGFLVNSAGNTYKATTVASATAGTAPTGTTTATDGGVTWTYEGVAGATTTPGDVLLGGSVFQTGTPITSPTLTLKLPAV